MKIFKRFRTDLFPWTTSDDWQFVCHCVDKTAFEQYIKDQGVLATPYEFKLEPSEDSQ